jgi:hypothetical protein
MQSQAMVSIAGIQVDLASLRPGKIRGKHGYGVTVDKTSAEVDTTEYNIHKLEHLCRYITRPAMPTISQIHGRIAVSS